MMVIHVLSVLSSVCFAFCGIREYYYCFGSCIYKARLVEPFQDLRSLS
jgi:hypothetical protein